MEKIDTVEDAIQMQYDLQREENSLSKEIESLLISVRECECKIKHLQTQVPDGIVLKSDAQELTTAAQFTASLASTVSGKMRKIDLVQNRVSECLQRVADISDLKKCTEGIQSALDNEEYENAAIIVQRFLSIDEAQVRKSAQSQGTSLDQAFAKLHEARKKLQQMVMKKFEDAKAEGDVASVERFFKLFPFLNQQEEGLKKFSEYLSSKIPSESTLAANSKMKTHHEQLGLLFQEVAKIIDVHQVLVETYYKHGNLLFVLQIIQGKCDEMVKRIFDDFKRTRNFNLTLAYVDKSLKTQVNAWSSAPVTKVDPRELDTLLIEIILMISRSQTYLAFLEKRATDDLIVAYQADSPAKLKESLALVQKLIRECKLASIMQELSGQYVLMEEYFMKESVVKAIQMDDGGPLTEVTIASSMFDDVFFIMKNCIRRAISSKNIDVLCAIVNHCITTLDTSYAHALQERIKYGMPMAMASAAASLDLSQAYNAIQAGRYLQSSVDLEKSKRLFLTGVNNLDLSSECILSLMSNIEEEAAKAFNFSIVAHKTGKESTQASEHAKLNCCLQELKNLIDKFASLTRDGIWKLYENPLKPLIKCWCDELQFEKQDLTENDVSELERNSPDGLRKATSTLLLQLDQVFKDLQPQLTGNCYNQLILVFSAEVATRIRNTIYKCSYNKVRVPLRDHSLLNHRQSKLMDVSLSLPFSPSLLRQLGALQLEKEVRFIINYLISLTSQVIRDKFTGLRLILQILIVESVSDAIDYGSNAAAVSPVSNKLPPSEVRSILKLRCDLKREEIKRLKFT